MKTHAPGLVGLVTVLMSGVSPIAAAEFELPQDPRVWFNSPPISLQAMQGKSVVLYFFEESCPRCRENWSSVVEAARSVAGQPVQLIAVNSGSALGEVAQYVRKNRIPFPVIADIDRSLERAAGVNQVSLQNIWQLRIVGPGGQVRTGSVAQLTQTLQDAAEEASWNVDPSGIPASLMPLWKQVEFGNFAAAAKPLDLAMNHRDPQVKAAAESLHAYVQQQISELAAKAQHAQSDGDLWQAYKLFMQLSEQFEGYEFSVPVESERQQLAQDEQVQLEIEALEQWQRAQKTVARRSTSPARLRLILSRIIEDYPDTEAAEMAAEALGK